MKKSLIALSLLASLLCAGCYSTRNVLYPENIQESTEKIAQQLNQQGYRPSGVANDEKNETIVTGTTYSYTPGYFYGYYRAQPNLENKSTNTNTYTFSDSKGNTAEYTLSHPAFGYDKGNHPYTTELSVVGCKTSRAEDFGPVCNDVVSKTVTSTSTTPAQVPDAGATSLVTIASVIGLFLLIAVIGLAR